MEILREVFLLPERVEVYRYKRNGCERCPEGKEENDEIRIDFWIDACGDVERVRN